MFYVPALFILVSGKTWTRSGEVVRGAHARWAGFGLLVMGIMMTLTVFRPEQQSLLVPMICLWPTALALGHILLSREDRTHGYRIPLEHLPARKVKRKRKNDELY
jgi:hypothetical protein